MQDLHSIHEWFTDASSIRELGNGDETEFGLPSEIAFADEVDEETRKKVIAIAQALVELDLEFHEKYDCA